jgi:ABC-type antimicrobial peptide transport system permease subunit
MVLCFFSLISSMTANIMEQTKEIAILRAVGITKSSMIRLYIYEAFTLVFSSCIIGMFVGIIVGFTMSMQRALFT